ncbi:MAG: hypothetical protein ACLQVN_01215, partial [Bryobacteraceae bacterium]
MKQPAFLLVLCLALPAPRLFSQAAAHKPPVAKPQPCPETAPGPLDFLTVVGLVEDPDFNKCVIEFVRKNKVSFDASPASISSVSPIDILKRLNNLPALLVDFIPPAPPPPPPPKLSGPINVRCEPADCEIIVNDHYYGRAAGGKKAIPDSLPAPGEAVLHVAHEGFAPETRTVKLVEDRPVDELFTLHRTVAGRRDAARNLLLRVVAAFGGVEGLAQLAQVSGSGTVTLLDEKQQPQEWRMRFSGGWASVNMSFKGARGECNTSTTGELTCKGKLRNSSEEGLLAQAMQRFGEGQLPTLLARLLTRDALAIDDSAPAKIESEGDPDSYILSLGNDGLPAEMVYRS